MIAIEKNKECDIIEIAECGILQFSFIEFYNFKKRKYIKCVYKQSI